MKKVITSSLNLNAYTLSFLFIISSLLFTSSLVAQSQVLVNKNWEVLYGNPTSGVEWAATTVTPLENIITVGNTVDASYNVNLLLVKRSTTGQVLWQKEYNAGANSKNYGIALTTDSDENIYVAGATYNPVNQNHDYLILKYNAGGTLLWSHVENGVDNGEDIPTAIILDESNNIYVTGGSYSNTSKYDFLTLRLNTNGMVAWKERYDHNQKDDFPIGLKTTTDGKIKVTGRSGNTDTDWDYASLHYDTDLDSLLSEVRTGTTGLEVPTAITQNDSGHYIVTGYGGASIQDDCYTVVLDADFNVLWEAWFDGEGLEDRATDVEVDNNNNVYVCGYTEKNNGGKDFLLIKYDGSGNEIWKKNDQHVIAVNLLKHYS